MPDFEIHFNTVQLIGAAEAAFKDANMLLGRQFQQSITANKWPWPNEPSPRDIVDTGQLRDSYADEPLSKTEHVHSWNTEYAMAVHEGAVFNDGHSMPGRPWVRTTLRDYDFAGAFSKLAQAELAKVKGPP